MKSLWFAVLMALLCLEGLGRKYIPAVPGVIFYFAKDVVLVFGFMRFRHSADIDATWRRLYGGFRFAWIAAFGWTLMEILNPAQDSFILGLVGMRAYWLWWFSPLLIAGVLESQRERRHAIYTLSGLAVIVALMAMYQFVSPPTDDVNLYGFADGESTRIDTALVASTGRARVASTFSYITGFTDFAILAPPLLLSLGLGTEDPPVRGAALVGALAISAAVPMAGSRGAIVLSLIVLVVIAWSAGLFFTVVGRRVLIGVIVGVVVGMTAFPDAMQGVQDRFNQSEEETQNRFLEVLQIIPPVTMATAEYPVFGLGTGMMQNARAAFHLPDPPYNAESENHRYLIEVGPVGFSLVWTAKLGLIIVLLKMRKILKRARRRAASGVALAYAICTFGGNLTFDHVYQALYFTGVGFVLAEVMAVQRARQEESVMAAESQPRLVSAAP
ncbi:MAG TPA: O-antigen ligase family protein [Polyangia bacterium]|nr:O-antigen ligase family protein [Polyangia bacterium]